MRLCCHTDRNNHIADQTWPKQSVVAVRRSQSHFVSLLLRFSHFFLAATQLSLVLFQFLFSLHFGPLPGKVNEPPAKYLACP